MGGSCGGAALGGQVVVVVVIIVVNHHHYKHRHHHSILIVLCRLLHKQLVDVEQEGGFEVADLAQKVQPGLASSNGRLFTISFIADDKRIPKGVGTLSKTLALVPSKNGSHPVAVLGEVDMSLEKKRKQLIFLLL